MRAKLSIKDLERLSGIKAHTIRIWEQRYGVLTPKRTTTNIRWYSQEELKTLLNVCLLYKKGIKISKIAQLNATQLTQEVLTLSKQQFSETDQINNLIIAMIELDELRFDELISFNIAELGFVKTIEKIIYPFLVKIGIMWLTDSICPAQEHFISNLIRQKLIVGIDTLPKIIQPNAKKVICFLPEGELHEISLLFSTYLLRKEGYKCIYLGQAVPFSNLIAVGEIASPDYLVSIFTTPLNDDTPETYIQQLSAHFPNAKLLLSGSQLFLTAIKLPVNATIFTSPTEITKLLSTMEENS